MQRLLAAAAACLVSFATNAALVESGSGTVSSVRAYPDGAAGLRVELVVTGANHSCGLYSNIYYFDSSKIPVDVVKSVLALTTSALVAGRPIVISYDCAIAGGGGYGWGVGARLN
ncbi:MAG TPA: hypothetical protein VE907_23670 [Gammaproteobacteria bacterium]|nr:hypothetical protein [Gammaproteobacteria bacterium]